jgi:hypothetical protein
MTDYIKAGYEAAKARDEAKQANAASQPGLPRSPTKETVADKVIFVGLMTYFGVAAVALVIGFVFFAFAGPIQATIAFFVVCAVAGGMAGHHDR